VVEDAIFEPDCWKVLQRGCLESSGRRSGLSRGIPPYKIQLEVEPQALRLRVANYEYIDNTQLLSTLCRQTTLLRWHPQYLLVAPTPASKPEQSTVRLIPNFITMPLLVSWKWPKVPGVNVGPARETRDPTEPVTRHTLQSRHRLCRARDNTGSDPSEMYCLRVPNRACWPRRRGVSMNASGSAND
jgi:hypothetical protein